MLVLVGCSSAEQEDCSCFNPGVVVSAGKGEVKSIVLGGKACETATIHCTDTNDGSGFVSGCEQYTISPTATGECTIHVETNSDSPLDSTRTIVDNRGQCCGGFDPSPPESYKIVAAHGT